LFIISTDNGQNTRKRKPESSKPI